MYHEIHHIVKPSVQKIRFETYCYGLFPQLPSNKSVKKSIKNGILLLNGEITEGSRWIKASDEITLVQKEIPQSRIFKLKMPVIYEDEYFAVVHKPAGFVTSANQYKTIANALAFNIQPSTMIDALPFPKPVHRLDAATTGLLIAAKTHQALILFGRMLAKKKIKKTYHAIVQGKLTSSGEITHDINHKEAITRYEILSLSPSLQNEYLTWLAVQPQTGRTHQIRIHLAHIGHPIVGDKIYGTEGNILKNKGLFLSAVELQFQHPFNNKPLCIRTDSPPKFASLMKREEKRWHKFRVL